MPDDPIVRPVTDEYVDENGNTVVVGYPPDGVWEEDTEEVGSDFQVIIGDERPGEV